LDVFGEPDVQCVGSLERTLERVRWQGDSPSFVLLVPVNFQSHGREYIAIIATIATRILPISKIDKNWECATVRMHETNNSKTL
jgi:hypothetical protein